MLLPKQRAHLCHCSTRDSYPCRFLVCGLAVGACHAMFMCAWLLLTFILAGSSEPTGAVRTVSEMASTLPSVIAQHDHLVHVRICHEPEVWQWGNTREVAGHPPADLRLPMTAHMVLCDTAQTSIFGETERHCMRVWYSLNVTNYGVVLF